MEQCPAPGFPPNTCSAFIDPHRFATQRTHEFQRASQWCWAACVSMICKWHGYDLPQPKIVETMHGFIVDRPGDDRVLTSALNRTWVAADGRRFNTSAVVFSPALGRSDVGNERIIEDLKNERPLICGARTHATVVERVDYWEGSPPRVGQVHVIDPYPGAAAAPFYARFLAPDEMTPIGVGGQLRYLASIEVTGA